MLLLNFALPQSFLTVPRFLSHTPFGIYIFHEMKVETAQNMNDVKLQDVLNFPRLLFRW